MADFKLPTREERLARLKQQQEELSKLKVGYDSNVLKLENGVTVVRILPPVGNMDTLFYHQQVGYHMIGNTVCRCSEFTTNYDLKCPVCEVLEVLRRGGPKDKGLASKLRLTKKYWMNVIVRQERDSFDTASGPYILKAGVTIFERTRSLVNDPDYGLIDDVEQGTDLKIERTGQMRDTKYEVNPRKGDYQPLMSTPKGELDMEAVTKILEVAEDLSYVIMPDNPDEDKDFLEQLGRDPTVKVYGFERTVAEYGVCIETIDQLDNIITLNSQQGTGWGDQGDGSYNTPSRSGSGQSRQQASQQDATDAIRARISKLRSKN